VKFALRRRDRIANATWRLEILLGYVVAASFWLSTADRAAGVALGAPIMCSGAAPVDGLHGLIVKE
jgi:hypothetical protein